MQRLLRDEDSKLSVQIYCSKCDMIIGSKPIHEARVELIQLEYQSGWLSEEDVKSISGKMFIAGCMATPYYPV